jgi:hypothetical protein
MSELGQDERDKAGPGGQIEHLSGSWPELLVEDFYPAVIQR